MDLKDRLFLSCPTYKKGVVYSAKVSLVFPAILFVLCLIILFFSEQSQPEGEVKSRNAAQTEIVHPSLLGLDKLHTH